IYQSGYRDAIFSYIRSVLSELNGAVYCSAPLPCGFASDSCGAEVTCCNSMTCTSGQCCVPVGESSCRTDADCCAGRCFGGVCSTICGNGIIEPGEACDPPGEQGVCGSGQACA